MKPGRNYSIKDIARLANVSIGTVDRVLHDRKGVSQTTKERVLAVIKKTGYKKNIMASRLKLASNHIIKIAVLLPEIKDDWSYWKWPKLGVTRAVSELLESGVRIKYFHFDADLEESFQANCRKILSENYSAIVTVPFMKDASNELVKLASVPDIFLDTYRSLNNSANFIHQDSHVAGMVAGRLLYNLVGEEGAYLVVNMTENGIVRINCQQRENGFRDFFSKNFPEKEFSIFSINHSLEDSHSISEELSPIFTQENIRGLFVTNSRAFMLREVMALLTDCFTVGFDLNYKNTELLREQEIHFIINQKPDYQGYMAIKGVYKYLTEGNKEGLNMKIPVEIIVKENIPIYEIDTI
ncbi:MAG: LacI family DNA-binding transcriptional regulator [Bacteroidetes bacterium]|nr:LacI family DNA-binding transcriptional regulator [Bacteroidota bacterium]